MAGSESNCFENQSEAEMDPKLQEQYNSLVEQAEICQIDNWHSISSHFGTLREQIQETFERTENSIDGQDTPLII